MDTVLGDEGYQVAFIVAALGTALGVVVAAARGSAHVGFALVAVVAAVVGLRFEYDIDARFVIGLTMLGLAVLIDPSATLLRIAALLSGAWLVVTQLAGIAGWMQIVGLVSIVAAALLAVSLDRVVPRCMPLLVLVSVGGIYACAPDTEVTKVVLGAVGPVVVLTLEPRLRSSAAIAPLVGLVVWLAVLEGRGRPGAVIGGVACLGVIVVAPLVRWRNSSFRAAVGLLAAHAAIVLYASRLAGLRQSGWAAVALCVPAFAITGFVLALVNRRARQ